MMSAHKRRKSDYLMQTIPCNICGSTSGTFVLRYEGYDVVRCNVCDLVFVNRQFTDDEMKQWYAEGYYTGQWERVYKDYLGEQEHRIAYLRFRVRELRQFVTSGRLLEIGCAAGFLLEAARPHFDVEGVELSEFSSRYARDVLHHKVHTGTLASANFPSSTFDVVVMSDVVEHLTDPRATLCEVSRVLKPDGVIIISTGNINSVLAWRDLSSWKLMGPPWHLYYYSLKTLRRLLTAVGLDAFHVYTNSRYTYSQNRVVNNGVLGWLTSRLGLGDIMFVYGQKAGAGRERIARARRWGEPDPARDTRTWRGLPARGA
jgi:SAM-dependent methyltransferase